MLEQEAVVSTKVHGSSHLSAPCVCLSFSLPDVQFLREATFKPRSKPWDPGGFALPDEQAPRVQPWSSDGTSSGHHNAPHLTGLRCPGCYWPLLLPLTGRVGHVESLCSSGGGHCSWSGGSRGQVPSYPSERCL